MDALRSEKRFTCKDWLAWDEDTRAEITHGNLIMMAPPTQRHQSVSGELFRQIANFLFGKPCKVFSAPFGVCLNESEDTAFEPDIVVVCDMSKLDGRVCRGAPDMVIEVLSPSTAGRDCITKYHEYLKSGVREYWIADPDTETVQIHTLNGGKYIGAVYGKGETVSVGVLDGCAVNLADVFAR